MQSWGIFEITRRSAGHLVAIAFAAKLVVLAAP
jgi:hypothetical protein